MIRRLAFSAICAAALWAGSGAAGAAEEAAPLTFTVRPSGVEYPDLDDALERRLRRADYLFRSICRNCGAGDRAATEQPFRPYDALGARPPSVQE